MVGEVQEKGERDGTWDSLCSGEPARCGVGDWEGFRAGPRTLLPGIFTGDCLKMNKDDWQVGRVGEGVQERLGVRLSGKMLGYI